MVWAMHMVYEIDIYEIEAYEIIIFRHNVSLNLHIIYRIFALILALKLYIIYPCVFATLFDLLRLKKCK